MKRRAFLKAIGAAVLLPILPGRAFSTVSPGFRRVRPSDAAWPSKSAWKQLNDAVGGNLLPVDFPLLILKTDPDSAAAKELLANLKNPYFIREQPGLTQSLGWIDGWQTSPSVYAVMARNANDIAAAVNFARENQLRIVVRGGGHSYQGTSNAPDSLLVWTRNMHDIEMHDAFVPQGCDDMMEPQHAVTVGAGTIGIQAYETVTTKGDRYVQGGGCLTVCLGGLIQSGGFGSYSKHYGTAAGGLLEAEVVTADGQIRIANACTNPDLFWALKGGGGGTFGVVSKMTLRTHHLPEFFGTVNFTVRASSDDAYRNLVRKFIGFYHDALFNGHWGEQVHVNPDNTLTVQMLCCGLNGDQMKAVWEPFLAWIKANGYSLPGLKIIGSFPARHFWDVQWWKEHWPEIAFPRNGSPLHALADDVLVHLMSQPAMAQDNRSGAARDNVWWKGNTEECAIYWWGYESLWLPASLLEGDQQQRLAEALFAASRSFAIELHFNKGLAGSPPDAIAGAKDTATNPVMLDAFALAIVADGEKPCYPGMPDHEPSMARGRKAAVLIDECVNQLRAIAGDNGAYVSESNYFQKNFQQAYWGTNYPRLAKIKKQYDPDGLFFVHNGVGSEQWSRDGFTRL